MVERFENLNIILGDWAKEKIHKSLVDALNRYEKQEDEKTRFYFTKWLRKNTRTVPVGSRARLSLTKKRKLTWR